MDGRGLSNRLAYFDEKKSTSSKRSPLRSRKEGMRRQTPFRRKYNSSANFPARRSSSRLRRDVEIIRAFRELLAERESPPESRSRSNCCPAGSSSQISSRKTVPRNNPPETSPLARLCNCTGRRPGTKDRQRVLIKGSSR